MSFLAFVELDFFLYSITKATFTGLHRMENDITFFDTAKYSCQQPKLLVGLTKQTRALFGFCHRSSDANSYVMSAAVSVYFLNVNPGGGLAQTARR